MNEIRNQRMKPAIHSLARKAGLVMLALFSIILAGFLVLTIILLALSPGKPQPFLDQNGKLLAGSISEKIFVNINGVEQGMFIKGENIDNPVLLYLHGGMPDYFLTQDYPTGLDEDFVVVWWEQRGSGLSFNSSIPKESITTEQLISDAVAVTNYLGNRFHREEST
jgi:pimeloyl-ACP methyl ester carboxylesterase